MPDVFCHLAFQRGLQWCSSLPLLLLLFSVCVCFACHRQCQRGAGCVLWECFCFLCFFVCVRATLCMCMPCVTRPM
jgi:hypothetical protein